MRTRPAAMALPRRPSGPPRPPRSARRLTRTTLSALLGMLVLVGGSAGPVSARPASVPVPVGAAGAGTDPEPRASVRPVGPASVVRAFPVPVGRAAPGPGALAGAAPTAGTADWPVAGGYRWPLDGDPRVLRPFQPPAHRWLPGHRGVDLSAGPGAVVRAAGPGVVYFAGMVAGRPVVSVAHSGGLRTTYEPVAATVRTGEPVSAGAPLGVLRAGHPGCAAPSCLHWGLRRGEDYLDPLSLLGLGRVRLLPLADQR